MQNTAFVPDYLPNRKKQLFAPSLLLLAIHQKS